MKDQEKMKLFHIILRLKLLVSNKTEKSSINMYSYFKINDFFKITCMGIFVKLENCKIF